MLWIAFLIVMPAAAPAAAAAPKLRPIDGTAAAGMVRGELRCAFAAPRRTTLLLAAADVGRSARATATIRTGARPVALRGVGTGGFDALVRGGVFRGAGITVGVARRARIATGTEEARHEAILRVASAGATRAYRGTWSCGP